VKAGGGESLTSGVFSNGFCDTKIVLGGGGNRCGGCGDEGTIGDGDSGDGLLVEANVAGGDDGGHSCGGDGACDDGDCRAEVAGRGCCCGENDARVWAAAMAAANLYEVEVARNDDYIDRCCTHP